MAPDGHAHRPAETQAAARAGGTAPDWRDDVGISYLALAGAFTITVAALLTAVALALT